MTSVQGISKCQDTKYGCNEEHKISAGRQKLQEWGQSFG